MQETEGKSGVRVGTHWSKKENMLGGIYFTKQIPMPYAVRIQQAVFGPKAVCISMFSFLCTDFLKIAGL
ncbi:MAG: hypothetical protein E7J94_05840 [Clostridium sp.]|nr:hypothetical protein [Clostridium sp.]